MPARILFVCVENACRSQMAEGFARLHGKGLVEAWSAGSDPAQEVHPKAIALMKEKGVTLEGAKPRGFRDLPVAKWDYVVTMGCGDACPFVPGQKGLNWGLPDPKNLPETQFRQVRDEIETRVRALIEEIAGALPPKQKPSDDPAKIESAAGRELRITWQDSHPSTFVARDLRLDCRCALCVDERSWETLLKPNSVPPDVRMAEVAPAGRYGLKIRFSDGHKTGIYTFERLRQTCPCGQCRPAA